MPIEVLELSRRFLVWLIAGAGALEFFALAMLSLFHGQMVDSVAWAICTVVMFVGVFVAENAKSVGGE